MMDSIKKMQKRLKALESEIAETKRRLPAHSTKPPVMMDLLALEDEYDEIQARLAALKDKKE